MTSSFTILSISWRYINCGLSRYRTAEINAFFVNSVGYLGRINGSALRFTIRRYFVTSVTPGTN